MENASPKKNISIPSMSGNAQKMLSKGLTGAGHRFQRAYANAGAIHIGDNEMIGMFDKARLNKMTSKIKLSL